MVHNKREQMFKIKLTSLALVPPPDTQPYHIRAEITNAVKNTAAILLDKTSSTLPIFNSLYNCGPANVMLEYYDPQKNHLNKA